MEKVIEMWLNPINLGVLFLLFVRASGFWLIARRITKTSNYRPAKEVFQCRLINKE